MFFLNRPLSYPCHYGSTTFSLPRSTSRKNVFGSYLGNTSNPLSLHVSLWKVSIILSNNADLKLITTLIFLFWWIVSVLKICQLYCVGQLYVGGNAAIADCRQSLAHYDA